MLREENREHALGGSEMPVQSARMGEDLYGTNHAAVVGCGSGKEEEEEEDDF